METSMANGFRKWAIIVLFLALGIAGSVARAASASTTQISSCTTAREYITTLEYLRDRKELALPEADARKTALEASKGCTGAAQRFIRVSLVLSQAGLGSLDAVKRGLEFAKRTDQETETFMTVFRRAFARDAMDLDLRSSIRMAEDLSRDFEGDTIAVRDDFERLLDFCSGSSRLGLPKPQCGSFAARLAKQGQKWSGGISVPYIQAFEFAVSEKGPSLPTSKAIEIANQLVVAGPGSTENFIAAYKYAVAKRGLALADQAALGFALKIGLETDGTSDAPPANKPVSK
jgi:hypothetical protein